MNDLVKTVKSITMLSKGLQTSLNNAQVLLDAAVKFNYQAAQAEKETAAMVDEMMD